MIKDAQDIKADFLFLDILINSLKAGNKISFSAKGTSMYPTIRENDILHIEPISPNELSERDIILYAKDNGVVAHRLVSINKQHGQIRFFTRGDNSLSPAEISESQILGKVFGIQREKKSFSPDNSLYYCFYLSVRFFFARLLRKLPLGFKNRFISLKRFILKKVLNAN